MKGLIIKDIINLRGQFKLFFIIIAMWFAIGVWGSDSTFFGGVMIMFVVMLPISTMSYDEKNKWNSMAITMPISRKDIVLAKYAFMGCCMLTIALISFIGNFIISKDAEKSLLFTFYAFPAGLIINAAIIPVLFKFGVEKGRVIFIIAMLLSCLMIVAVVKGAQVWDVTSILNETVFNAVLWAVSLVMTAASMAISIRIYEKADF